MLKKLTTDASDHGITYALNVSQLYGGFDMTNSTVNASSALRFIVLSLFAASSSYLGLIKSYANNIDSSFVAFNDLSWSAGQNSQNITIYTTENGTGTPPEGSSGHLVNFYTGEKDFYFLDG